MENYYGWGLPIDISTHGAQIDRLIYVIHLFMAALFVGWVTFVILALVRFRARPGHAATYKVGHFKTPNYIEVFVAIVEVVLLVGFSFPVFSQVKNELPAQNEALEVRVVAEQFAWNIHYPGPDRIFGKTDIHRVSATNPVGLDPEDAVGRDDIVTINQLHVPVAKPVIARLSSKDVVHSFTLPVMRVKQDVIPGMDIPIWFEATQTGNFEISCAQLCGLGHYRMRGFFTVETDEAFNTWFNEELQRKFPPPPAPAPTSPPTPV